ncbi:MAG TPA: STAS domain-containing protein [Candidatus Dormibacteraeota bacterium]|jgi:anti-anti-sigma factor
MAQRADDDRVYADKQLVIRRTSAPEGLTVSGAIDAYNVDAFARTLDLSLEGKGDLTIDLQDLEFCDVSAIRALVAAAKNVDDGRRLVLSGLPEPLRNVMTIVGWNDIPGLVISDADPTDQ